MTSPSPSYLDLFIPLIVLICSMSGAVFLIRYDGIQLLQPAWFDATAVLICAIVALSIGRSWTTVGRIGVGRVGIATLLYG